MAKHDPSDFERLFGAVDEADLEARAAEWEIEDLLVRARQTAAGE